MELIEPTYIKIADVSQAFALRNKSKDKNSILLAVKSDTQPSYNKATNENAFEIELKETLTSSDLPPPVWIAPLNKSVRISLQTWAE